MQRTLEGLGHPFRMRAICRRAGLRQLPERVHRPHSPRPVDRSAGLLLPTLPGTDCMARQRSSAELGTVEGTLPRL